MIYHYTTVDTLALILSSLKIRFNRLDRVDDVREAQSVAGIPFGKYFFVSCWTNMATESIPQWHMYTDRMQGVRLGMPIYPFLRKRLRPLTGWTNATTTGDLRSPLEMNEMMTSTYLVLPSCMDDKQFGGPVMYVDDIEKRYTAAIRIVGSDHVITGIEISNPSDLVRLKSRDWSFQDEYRFHLFILPSLAVPSEGPGTRSFYEQLPEHIARSMLTGIDPSVDYIDVDLDPAVLDTMEVTTGPLCTSGAILCVRALLKEYAPKAVLRPSVLSGQVRQRNSAT